MKQSMVLAESEWAHADSEKWANAESVSVLLIDASFSEATCITQTILRGELPYRIHIVKQNNLIQGINFLRTSTVDVLLLDLDLSDAREYDDISFMHKLFPELPIIVLSNASTMEIHQKALQCGAQAFLVKEQCNSITLRNAICQVITQQKTEKLYQQASQL